MNDIITLNGVKYKRVDTVVEDKAKTGYERVDKGEEYFYNGADCKYTSFNTEDHDDTDHDFFGMADYYSDKTIAKNNARADGLMRRLRQWQALNDKPVDWTDIDSANKCFILYNYEAKVLAWSNTWVNRFHSTVYFSSQEKAEEAIEEFRDELLWYFTEYQSRLDEPKRGGQEVNT